MPDGSPKLSIRHLLTRNGEAKAGGRGSRIRTCDLQYPKLIEAVSCDYLRHHSAANTGIYCVFGIHGRDEGTLQ